MSLVAISIVIGLAGAFAATRLLNSLLFGVGAWDPITFSAIIILISLVAFLAGVMRSIGDEQWRRHRRHPQALHQRAQ